MIELFGRRHNEDISTDGGAKFISLNDFDRPSFKNEP